MLRRRCCYRRLQFRNFFREVKYLTFDGFDNVKTFDSIPSLPQLPLLGNWHLYKLGIYDAEKYHKVLCKIHEKYGPIVVERIGWQKPIVHVFDVEDAETIYRNEGKIPYVFPLLESSDSIRREIEYISPGLGFTNGDEWYKLRNGVRNLMMRAQSMQQYLPCFEIITEDLIEEIKNNITSDGCVHNLRYLIGLWSQECSGAVCFDTRLGYLHGPNVELGYKIIEANRTLFYLSALLKFSLPFYEYVNTPKMSKIKESEYFICRTANKYLEEALKKIQSDVKNNKNGQSFIASLLSKEELTKKDITVITLSLFVDGLSTVVPTMLHNLYALASNQHVQQKAYEEIRALNIDNSNLTPEIMEKLPYLKAIIKETFRMYPNGTEIARINQKPLILSGYYIPAQSKISINMIVNLRLKKYFSDPDVFKPERWLRGTEANNINPMILRPFGHGSRTCTGRRFSEWSMYTALFKIIKNFHLVYPENENPMDTVFHILIFPEKELPIKFIKR